MNVMCGAVAIVNMLCLHFHSLNRFLKCLLLRCGPLQPVHSCLISLVQAAYSL